MGDDNINGNDGCQDDEQCDDYGDICEEDQDDNNIDYSNFLDCVEFENNNGKVLYIGPHCYDDGVSIVLGLYSDDQCSQYLGDSIAIDDFTNMAFDDDGLYQYYNADCISCQQSDLYQKEDNDDNDYAVSEICENLFDQSAKCHKYFYEPVYNSEEQKNNEDKVCSFIGNVLSGQYNEYGQIFLYVDDFEKVSGYARNTIEGISILHIVAILVSFMACIILLSYSCYLHRAITRKAPWRPRRGGPEALAGQISRQNSGIVMGRSRSG